MEMRKRTADDQGAQSAKRSHDQVNHGVCESDLDTCSFGSDDGGLLDPVDGNEFSWVFPDNETAPIVSSSQKMEHHETEDLGDSKDRTVSTNDSGAAADPERKQNKKRRNHTKYRKAPQAPRRFKSPYILFSISKMQEFKKTVTGTMDVTAMSRTVAKEWKNLPPSERAKWDEAARQDKIRYENEKSSYTGPWQVSSKRSPKDPTAPKRPPSAFLLYCKTERSRLKEENPGMKNTDLSVLLGKKWKEETEERKLPYVEQERIEREAYKMRMAQWRESRRAEGKSEAIHPHVQLSPATARVSVESGEPNSTNQYSSEPTNAYPQPQPEQQEASRKYQDLLASHRTKTEQRNVQGQSDLKILADSLLQYSQRLSEQHGQTQPPKTWSPPVDLKPPPPPNDDPMTTFDAQELGLGATKSTGLIASGSESPSQTEQKKPSARVGPKEATKDTSRSWLYSDCVPYYVEQGNSLRPDRVVQLPAAIQDGGSLPTRSQHTHQSHQQNENPSESSALSYSLRDYQLMLEFNEGANIPVTSSPTAMATATDPDSPFQQDPQSEQNRVRNLPTLFQSLPPPGNTVSSPEPLSISEYQKQLKESYEKAIEKSEEK